MNVRQPANISPGTAIVVSRARSAGISKSRLQAADLITTTRGIRHSANSTPPLPEQVRALTAVVSGAVASHATAAALWGIPLPWRLTEHREIHLSRQSPLPAPRRRGVIGHKLQITSAEITFAHGVWLTTPARTWRDLASMVSLGELVAAGDFLVTSVARGYQEPRRALCTITELRQSPPRHVPGNTLIRQAAGLVRSEADSPQETKLRLALIAAGLQEPVVDCVLWDKLSGAPLRWGDLAYPEFRLVFQYEGDQHRHRFRYAADIARDEDWQEAGWTVLRITSSDLDQGAGQAVAKVKRALARLRSLTKPQAA